MQSIVHIFITYPKNSQLCRRLKNSGSSRKKRDVSSLAGIVGSLHQTLRRMLPRQKRQALSDSNEDIEGTAIVTSDESVLNRPTALIIFQNADA